MGLDRYKELATKYLNKTISPEEEEEFAAWYNSNQEKPLIIPESFAKNEKAHWTRIFFKIKVELSFKKNNRIIPPYVYYVAASIALILVFSATYFYTDNDKPWKIVVKKHIKNDILPGGNRAVLTLADGSEIMLDNAKKGILANQGKTILNKSRVDVLVYQAPKNVSNSSLKITYNTICTPKGGQFQVILPDGSRVWLNAASSIKFPTAVSGTERKVVVSGEAYFEVSKNKAMPFRVVTNKQTIEVLGTHFNINAYSDESRVKTTLIEGCVKINYDDQTVLLKPNQQASINTANSVINIKEVDTEDVIAWKNGVFTFESADIAFIMRQAARWYDVSIFYDGKLPSKRFTGSISRNVNLSELLNMLKYTGINFKIEGKTIKVTS